MREYKFRAWNKRWKAMEEWNILKNKITGRDFNDDDTLIIMEWTGEKDKNEKDIYEGDIVSTTSIHPGESPFEITGIVKSLEGTWVIDDGTKLVKLWSEAIEKEVIGNKFENPEMNFILQKNAQHSKLINPLKQFSYDLKKILGE